MSYILAIDQGTTSSRAIVFDAQAKILGIGQKELRLHYPANGWVEQEPEDIWKDTVKVCKKAVEAAGLAFSDIAAIGITNQRETTVLWDKKTGKALSKAIVWQDRRTAELCAKLKADGLEDTIRCKTGLLLDPYFSGTKLGWLLDNVAGARIAAEKGQLAFGTIDSFLLWRLTGGKVHATDATNASRTLLFNIVEQKWDDALLKILNIPASLLPEVKDSSGLFGRTAKDIFGATMPVTGIAGDQQAALFGQACFAPGMIKSTYGTGCFALMNIGTEFRPSKNNMLTTVACRLKGKTTYAIEGAIFVAGAAVQWLRDGLGIIKDAGAAEEMAKTLPDNGGVYMVPAFTGLGAPYWDPDARGAIVGLTRDTSAAHLARAALEAQGYQTRDLIGAMADDAGLVPTTLRVDGGMTNNNWMCQFLADMTGLAVERPAMTETTALGAAYLAGLEAGVYSSLEAIEKSWKCDARFIPASDKAKTDMLYQGWQMAVRRVLLK